MPTIICIPIQTLVSQCRTDAVMSKLACITAIVLAASLLSCATPYQARGYLNVTDGGFSEQELESGLWRVRFEGNPDTTEETVQTFWLYRCAELALQKGFDGFAILSPIRLTSAEIKSEGRFRSMELAHLDMKQVSRLPYLLYAKFS